MRKTVMLLSMLGLSGCWFGGVPSEAAEQQIVSSVPRAGQPLDCPTEGAAIQVLGSGGPIAEGGAEARAGTSYLLWIDGEARVLVDAGSGSFFRFAQAGGSIATLDAIVLTHLHADHAGDLIDILNSGGFEGRTEPLIIIGPDAAPRFAGTKEFLARLMSKESGAFAYNGGFLDGTENKPLIEAREITTEQGSAGPAGLDVSNDYSIMAHPVHHGPVPSLGFVIEAGDRSVAITGDQSFLSERFLTDLTNAKPTILFAHHVIHGGDGQPRGLHRTPSQIGELASALAPANLVLTHNMQRSLKRLDEGLEAIGKHYQGPVSVANDLDCYAL
ncbi:MAG: MBL fold metallo-hydrolase [Erythrobacter sp.]|uniref:MBL fold metallo-hydrolase n=1 Tax=Erythrobacter sp. TaxID=1042 RepID=UPI003264ABFC